jgi:hypothetical protein
MKYIIRNNKLYQFGVVRVTKIIQVPNSIYEIAKLGGRQSV